MTSTQPLNPSTPQPFNGEAPELVSSSMRTFFQNIKVLITGHTGFKGTWLTLWLQQLGAQVHGISLPPATTPNLFTLLNPQLLNSSTVQPLNSSTHQLFNNFIDIRDFNKPSTPEFYAGFQTRAAQVKNDFLGFLLVAKQQKKPSPLTGPRPRAILCSTTPASGRTSCPT